MDMVPALSYQREMSISGDAKRAPELPDAKLRSFCCLDAVGGCFSKLKGQVAVLFSIDVQRSEIGRIKDMPAKERENTQSGHQNTWGSNE